MNYLVFLDPPAGELEKILSGVKCMLAIEFDPAASATHPVSPGDTLYFLRKKGEFDLRVAASIVRVLFITNMVGDDLSHTLKELQPRLQLTEEQYNTWVSKAQVLLVEFECAHKVEVLHVDARKITNRSGWIAFEDFSQITE
jgi:hypothetical protein